MKLIQGYTAIKRHRQDWNSGSQSLAAALCMAGPLTK